MAPRTVHHHHHHLLLLPPLNPPASSSSELAFWVRAVRCVAGLQIVKVCISKAEEASDPIPNGRWKQSLVSSCCNPLFPQSPILPSNVNISAAACVIAQAACLRRV